VLAEEKPLSLSLSSQSLFFPGKNPRGLIDDIFTVTRLPLIALAEM